MKQLFRAFGFILIFYSIVPNIIKEMTLAQDIMFGLGASWLFYEGDRKWYHNVEFIVMKHKR